MCNLVAVKTHTRPGDALVAEAMAHVIRAESGGAALASGVMVQGIQTERGVFTPGELETAMDRVVAVPVPYGQPVGLVCVEQTHNFGGGAVWSREELARRLGLRAGAGRAAAHGRRASDERLRSERRAGGGVRDRG